MADTENPVSETQEQQEAVAEDSTNEEAAAETPKENGESQETQEGGAGDGDAKAEGDDVNAGEGEVADAGNGGADDSAPDATAAETTEGDGGDGQEQTEEGQREATPAVPVEEPAQEPESNGVAEEPQASTEPESAPEPEAEPQQQEPAEEPEPEPTESRQQESAMTMPEEQMTRCKHYFDRKAVDGRLDIKGFKLLFRLMGEVLSAEDASKIFEDGKTDDNGTIDFEEFCRLYCNHGQEEHSRKTAMMDSINKLFPDMDGQQVELKKVKSLLLKMQRPDLDMRLVREKSDLNPGDIHRMVKTMDKQGNGLISKEELVDTLCKHLEHA